MSQSCWRIPYRDHVLRAFRYNMPCDRFTRGHLAGDLLRNATRDQKSRRSRVRTPQQRPAPIDDGLLQVPRSQVRPVHVERLLCNEGLLTSAMNSSAFTTVIIRLTLRYTSMTDYPCA